MIASLEKSNLTRSASIPFSQLVSGFHLGQIWATTRVNDIAPF